jgi:hypothetical protein
VQKNKEDIAASLGTMVDHHNNNYMTRWMRLRAGENKYKKDATIFTEQEWYGIGMCLRNEHNKFAEAKTCLGTKDHHNLVMQKFGLKSGSHLAW